MTGNTATDTLYSGPSAPRKAMLPNDAQEAQEILIFGCLILQYAHNTKPCITNVGQKGTHHILSVCSGSIADICRFRVQPMLSTSVTLCFIFDLLPHKQDCRGHHRSSEALLANALAGPATTFLEGGLWSRTLSRAQRGLHKSDCQDILETQIHQVLRRISAMLSSQPVERGSRLGVSDPVPFRLRLASVTIAAAT